MTIYDRCDEDMIQTYPFQAISQVQGQIDSIPDQGVHLWIFKNAFLKTEKLLRTVLSQYVQHPSEKLQFTYNAYGKPDLIFPSEENRFSFNVSHSDSFFAIALSNFQTIGVDIEKIRNIELADFEYLGLGPCRTREEFFRLWTKLEAQLKARGTGFAYFNNATECDFNYETDSFCFESTLVGTIAVPEKVKVLTLFTEDELHSGHSLRHFILT